VAPVDLGRGRHHGRGRHRRAPVGGPDQRIAAGYAATATQLESIVAGVDPAAASPERQALFVAEVERVLVAQNDGWTDLLSPTSA
jgi:hypothetical protein